MSIRHAEYGTIMYLIKIFYLEKEKYFHNSFLHRSNRLKKQLCHELKWKYF